MVITCVSVVVGKMDLTKHKYKLTSKKLLLTCALSITSIISADVVQLRPMYQEDPHFIQYRCLMIEESINSIDEILEKLKLDEIDKDIAVNVIEEHVKLIKFNLGYSLENEVCD